MVSTLTEAAHPFLQPAGTGPLDACDRIRGTERATGDLLPPINSATLLTVLRGLEGLGRRWAPGTATFPAVAGVRVAASKQGDAPKGERRTI